MVVATDLLTTYPGPDRFSISKAAKTFKVRRRALSTRLSKLRRDRDGAPGQREPNCEPEPSSASDSESSSSDRGPLEQEAPASQSSMEQEVASQIGLDYLEYQYLDTSMSGDDADTPSFSPVSPSVTPVSSPRPVSPQLPSFLPVRSAGWSIEQDPRTSFIQPPVSTPPVSPTAPPLALQTAPPCTPASVPPLSTSISPPVTPFSAFGGFSFEPDSYVETLFSQTMGSLARLTTEAEATLCTSAGKFMISRPR